MSAESPNPFVLPGLGQSGDQAQNPLLAGMEMMRQAWQGMAGSGGLGQSAMAAPMTLEELDRRIADLRTVENWLRMNLSMLTSAIQGLEVQRATISTLRSFVETAAGAGKSGGVQSPLEAVLGIHKSDAAGARPEGAAAGEAPSGTAAMPSSAQAWWNMLQGQFDTLAAATTATMRGAEAVQAAAQQAGAQASGESAVKSTPSKTATRRKPASGKRGPAAGARKGSGAGK
jgi:hypothetical protein